MHTVSGAALAVMLFTVDTVPRTQPAPSIPSPSRVASAPLAVRANDQRTAAGRFVDGVLQVELDVVEATFTLEGSSSPAAPTFAFAERGQAPQFPGPLLRLRAGTPVRITVRNTLGKSVHVRGLGDRTRGDTAVRGQPAFLSKAPLVLAAGEERVVQFTPSAAVTSFYMAAVARDSTSPAQGQTGALAGAFVVDAAGTTPPVGERIFFISLNLGLTINGRSWPYTERLRYAEGEAVHWRVINASEEYHPMHLHGAYFTVHTKGDAQADTVIPLPRPLVVTEGMREFSSMQLSWTPHTSGNWLFHCHLIAHSQGPLPDTTAAATAARDTTQHAMSGMSDDMPMRDAMAGLIMGITVTPRVAAAAAPPANARRLDLWTGTRAKVFGDSTGYGFVLQRGVTPPAPDSIVVPGSPLVLTRGEPTRIVVHNRLSVPLSLHWHGMELPSTYDGVGHFSGAPGHVRPPIAAGDSMSVYMAPPRAGTFMYHIHGEAGAELQQGLYGALVVLEKGRAIDAVTDRLFVLASRGSTFDAPPAINGRGLAPAERFDAGMTYRLRFMHISTNDVRNVRLLRDGKPVRWRPLARDGATLPDRLRAPVDATLRMDVGQTFDAEWTPAVPGVYTLEVETESIIIGRPGAQRVAFAVGPVPDSALRIAATGTSLPLADVPREFIDKMVGAYAVTVGGTSPEYVSLWRSPEGLALSRTVAGVESPAGLLIPLADGTFVPGTNDKGVYNVSLPLVPHRLDGSTVAVGAGSAVRTYSRQARATVDSVTLSRYVGAYANGIAVKYASGALLMSGIGPNAVPMIPVSPSRFLQVLGGTTFTLEFASKDGEVVSFTVIGVGFTAPRVR